LGPILPGPSLKAFQTQDGSPSSLTGYQEPNEEEPSLSSVLNSLIHFIRDPNSFVQLLIFLGKSVITPSVGNAEASCLCSLYDKGRKEFSWSRGLGLEYSHVKTRSTRKKSFVESQVTIPGTSTECGALRALKALVRAK